ncbi:MAG: TGS domain-containing protein [Chloroflexi bacterium]|nr:TGS domain-containing protein [Chloroflexota bacterium]
MERHVDESDSAEPFAVALGSTVDNLADVVHHDLHCKLKYAVLSGASDKFSSQRVGRHDQLEDEDIVELYA